MPTHATTFIRSAYRQYFANAALILTIIALGIMLVDIAMPAMINETSAGKPWLFVREFSLEVAFAFLIAALLIFTTERRSRDELYAIFDAHLGNIRRTVRVGIEEIGKIQGLCSFLAKVNSDSDNPLSLSSVIIRELSDEIYRKYVDGLLATKTGFKIDDISWSLETNELLYKALLQAKVMNQEIRVTHTDNLDIWLDEYEPEETLKCQKRLSEENNVKIIKIFVGPEALDRSSKYQAAIEKMRKYNIEAKYVRHSTPSDIIDMTWLPNAQLVMTWRSRAENNISEIEMIELSSDEELQRKLESDWAFLLDRHEEEGQEERVSEARQPVAILRRASGFTKREDARQPSLTSVHDQGRRTSAHIRAATE